MCRSTGSIGLAASGTPGSPSHWVRRPWKGNDSRRRRSAATGSSPGSRPWVAASATATAAKRSRMLAQHLGHVVVLARERDEHRALDARLRHPRQQVLDPGLALRRRQLVDRARQLVRAAEHVRVRVDDHRRAPATCSTTTAARWAIRSRSDAAGSAGTRSEPSPTAVAPGLEPLADLVVADAAGGQERGAAERSVQRLQVPDAERPRREELDHAGRPRPGRARPPWRCRRPARARARRRASPR